MTNTKIRTTGETYSILPSEKEGYVKIEADVPIDAVHDFGSVPPEDERQRHEKTGHVPAPPDATTGSVAGYGLDDIVKAPVTPPSPNTDNGAQPLVDKISDAGYKASAGIGPTKPNRENRIIVSLGIFTLIVGLVGVAFLQLGTALIILALGFVIAVIGSFVSF